MKEPEWIEYDVAPAIHEAQLAEHGGLPGIRDQGLLESALNRAVNLFNYSPKVSLRGLAAAYAAGIIKNHPFLDGNKRSGWIVCALFLELNGIAVTVDQAMVVEVILQLASGSIDEEGFLLWLEKNVPLPGRTKRPGKTKKAVW